MTKLDETDMPYVYIDVNVILDVIRGRKNKASFALLEKIRNGYIRGCTSAFSLLELIDKEQEYTFIWRMIKDGYSFDEILRGRKNKNLKEFDLIEAVEKIDRVFVKQYKKCVDFYYLEDDGWDKAIELMQTINLTSEDAIHLASALMAGCDLLVSNDQHFLENAKKVIPACSPENAEQLLKKMGFQLK